MLCNTILRDKMTDLGSETCIFNAGDPEESMLGECDARISDTSCKRDFVLVTPPADPTSGNLQSDRDSLENIHEVCESEGDAEPQCLPCIDNNCSQECAVENTDKWKMVKSEEQTTKKSSGKTLSSSRSCGNISAEYFSSNLPSSQTSDSAFLQLPTHRKTKRSLSAEFEKPKSRKNTGKRAEKTKLDNRCPPSSWLQQGSHPRRALRKDVSRTRSSSPVLLPVLRLRVAKATNPGDVSPENTKPGWPRTLRFLSRKATSAPTSASVNAHSEFVWQEHSNASSTSDVTESADMIVGQTSVSDTWQPDTNNGIESPLVQALSMPLGSTAGSTSSANGILSDVPDGPMSDAQKNRQAIDHLQQKILKISEQIKIEQASRDDNVTEYLKLAKDADKQQAARIKSVFEKKNQKSKAIVTQLQKKLETYHRKLKEAENSGPTRAQPKYGFKEVGAKFSDFSGGVVDSVKGSLSGLSQVTQNAAGAIVSKPKDLASKLKNRFGSVDNIQAMKDEDDGSEDLNRCNSADDVSMSTSGSVEFTEHPTNNVNHPHVQQQHYFALRSQMQNMQRQLSQVREIEAQQDRLKSDVEQLTAQVQRGIGLLTNSLQEERFRCARLEDQLHDLSEMHNREMNDIKQDFASLEEKLEYHAQERARDIQEALESCQTRISKMEVQQHHQNQQLVTMEGVENATARALLGKLINLLLSVLAVILVFVSTVSSIVMPFFRSQARMVFTAFCIVFLAVLYRNGDRWSTYISSVWSGR